MELPAGWKRVAAVGALGLVMVMLLAAAVSGGDRSVQAGVDSALTGANITLAELQAHRAAGSCWVCVHGRVLDVSAFRAKHPGGADKIACGTDLTASFQQKHGAIANLDLKLAGRFAADIRVVGMFAPVSAPPPPPAPPSRARGAVSSTHFLATEAGFAALEAGGNAVDAAAVMQFMLNVVQPQSTGIGGGCFVVIYNASTGEVRTLDGREEAPGAYHENTFCQDPACAVGPCECREGVLGAGGGDVATALMGGGHSVGVPGVPAAVERMLREGGGTFSLAEAVAPAVARARAGFEMYVHLHSNIRRAAPRLRMSAAAAKLFLREDGVTPRVPVGGVMTNAELADTLEQLGAEGVDWFYRGALAEEVHVYIHVCVHV